MLNELSRFLRDVVTSSGNTSWRVQFFQHLVTGIIATAAHYTVMWFILSVEILPTIATTIGFIAGATTRFLFSYFHIFEPERDWSAAVPYFILALGLQMLLNAFLLSLFISLNIPVWPSQVLTTGLMTILNFMVYKFWVFK